MHTIILLRGTEKEVVTAQFDVWLTDERKGVFHFCPHEYSCQQIFKLFIHFGFIVYPFGALEQSVMKTKK